MDIKHALGTISDKLDEQETRRKNMTPSQKWIRRAKNPIGYLTAVIVAGIIWMVLGSLATKASQATGFFPTDDATSFTFFSAGLPALAAIVVIVRAIVCLVISCAFKLIENGIHFVKRL